MVTRDFTPQKPDPAPVLHICDHWGFSPHHVLVVGDHTVDILCGQSAGTGTCTYMLGMRLKRRRCGGGGEEGYGKEVVGEEEEEEKERRGTV